MQVGVPGTGSGAAYAAPHGPPIEGFAMSTDEKIAAVLAAYPPVLRDANPGYVCLRSVAIVGQLNGGCQEKRRTLPQMNFFHIVASHWKFVGPDRLGAVFFLSWDTGSSAISGHGAPSLPTTNDAFGLSP